ncbi:hypothetical protein CEXT_69341 [Caerostris extrusa]|uniref:Uncharacterized protein n=1 Tax=Caerostris extrusa TaxID=172846 RepID=A0AAV4P5E2_CAEEX|nr:hypothetical protein CEXT_69341 [Caerostris extrusa]
MMIQKHYNKNNEERFKDMRKVKRSYIRKEKNISRGNTKNPNYQKESRTFYKLINYNRKKFKPITITCRGKKGELVGESHEGLKLWKIFFSICWKREIELATTLKNLYFPMCGNDSPPSLDEMKVGY